MKMLGVVPETCFKNDELEMDIAKDEQTMNSNATKTTVTSIKEILPTKVICPFREIKSMKFPA